MTGRCRTCKWWEPWREQLGGDDASGNCLLFSSRITQQEAGIEPGDVRMLARASGHYGYDADFVTGPDFGCVQHEPTEGDDA